MTTVPTSQLTLNFEPSLAEKWGSLREFIAYRIGCQPKPAKSIAADLDIAPSTLSRKLNPSPEDSQRFNVDDLEGYLRSTGDVASVIEYLAAKFMAGGDEARKARLTSRVEGLVAELQRTLGDLKA